MPIRCKLLILLAVVALSVGASAVPKHAAVASHGMVASVHELASRAGVEIMKSGGNAIDAAVATGFVLAVVHPQAGNIGGGGFMLIRMADGKTHFLDYREKAPAAATENMYLDAKGDVIPDLSLLGYKSAGVPGSVAGLVYAEQKFGKLTLAKVMASAVRLAREGFVLTREDAEDLKDEDLAKFAASKRIFQNGGKGFSEGDILRQPELARTLERIAAKPDDFYHGALASEIAAAIQKAGGIITTADLAHYEVKEREPIRGTYRGYEVISSPPPSSGGTVMLEALNILEGFDLGKMGNRSATSIHVTAEAFSRAFYDRAEFLGDPDFTKLPIPQLLDRGYAAKWRETIDLLHASKSDELHRPRFEGLDQSASLRPPSQYRPEPEHTTHYSVVDSDGNAVAVTTTLNDSFGSRATVEGLGFLLNDEMDDFASKQGVPNGYGLIQGPANAIGPGKRPLSAMTPTIVLKDGKLFLVLGTPGGPRIITTVANILMGVIDYHMPLAEAVDAPRFHHQWKPDEIVLEHGFSPDTIALLKTMGHTINLRDHYWSDGECIAVDSKTGLRYGASDGRNNGKAVGY